MALRALYKTRGSRNASKANKDKRDLVKYDCVEHLGVLAIIHIYMHCLLGLCSRPALSSSHCWD